MLKCKSCGNQIEIQEALEKSPFCWPLLQAIWHVCTNCNEGNHIRFIQGEIQIIEIISAPGPEWKILDSQKIKSVSFRVDPDFLHVWFGDKHYEVQARK